MTAKKTASKAPAKSPSLKVERIFDASPRTLWSYWTDPAKFAKWFNPAPGMDLVVHEYDVRVGGHVRFDMPQLDGSPNPQEGVFHALRPYREIVSGSPDQSFLIAVKFAAVGKRTRMTVTVTGVPKDYQEGATKGWNAGFDKLTQLLRASPPTGRGFTIERTFRARIESLWALWTTKRGIESWWGPEGFTTKVHTLDLRPGGTFEYTMTAVGPDQIAALKEMGMPLRTRARNKYTEVASPHRLAYKTTIDFVPGIAPYAITSLVEFQELREGTKMVFTSSKLHDAGFQEMARQGQESQLGKLAKFLAQVAAPEPSHNPVAVTLPSPREILISRVFDAPRRRVFQAHVDAKAMEEWWGPREYTTKVVTWDLRKGGSWRIVQRTPDGTEHGFHGVFREIAPPERLGWTFEYEGTPGHVVTQDIAFEDLRGGKTKLTVRASFANPEDRDAMLASGMEWGMRQSYERLDELTMKGE